MGNLHKYFISGVAGIILLGALASLAAVFEAWSVAIVLTHGSLILVSLIVLLSTRYVVRLLRTQERKSRSVTERMIKLIEASTRREQESYNDLRSLNESTRKAIEDAITKAIDTTQDSSAEVKHKLREFDTVVR